MKTLKDHIKEKLYSHLREDSENWEVHIPMSLVSRKPRSLEGRIAQQRSRSNYLMRTIIDPAHPSLPGSPHRLSRPWTGVPAVGTLPAVHDPKNSPHGEYHDLGLAHACYLLCDSAERHRRKGDHAQAKTLLQMANSIHTGPLGHLSMHYDDEHDRYASTRMYPPNMRINDLHATYGNDWRDPRNDLLPKEYMENRFPGHFDLFA